MGRLGAFLATASLVMPMFMTPLQAQSATWLPAENLSRSGGAGGALLALGADDAVYSVWWDAVDGFRYTVGRVVARTVEWTEPRGAPDVDGGQDLRDPQRPRMLAPQRPSLFAAAGSAHYLYFTDDDRLLDLRIVRGRAEKPAVVSEDAIGAAGAVDVSGTLHLAYAVGSADGAGIYYSRRTTSPSGVLAASSRYLRGAPQGDVQLDVAADGLGGVLIVWRQRIETRGMYVVSRDGGRTWSEPQEIAPRSGLLGAQSFISASAPTPGEFLLVWRDIGAPGCGLVQKRSSDGGVTWGDPQRVMEDATPCPTEWRMVRNDGATWLLGAAQGGRLLLAVWDGASWSRMGTVAMTHLDASQSGGGALLGFSCLGVALGGRRLGVIGCDARGDVVASLSAGSAEAFVAEVQRRWIELRTPFEFAAPPRALTTAQGVRGEAFTAWSTGRTANDDGETALMLSTRTEGEWSPAVQVLSVDGSGAHATSLRRPALAVSDRRVHVVWQGGRSGAVYYSSAALRDATTRDGWSSPMALPALSAIGGAPAIAVDPSNGSLLVMYAVPYNEERGLYVVRSEDDGATWHSPRRVIDATAWTAIDDVRLSFDRRTRTWHAVFFQLDAADGDGRRAVHHVRSNDGGVTWRSSDVVVAEGDVRDARIAATAGDRVIVVWNRTRPTGVREEAAPFETWSRISGDGGRTWAARVRVPGFGAVSGAPAMLTDESGRVILSAVGETADRAAVVLTSEWGEQGWRAADAAPLHRPAAVGSSLDLLPDQSTGMVQAVLRSATLQSDGALRMRIDALQRRFDVRTAALRSTPTAPPASTAPSSTDGSRASPSTQRTPAPTAIVIAFPMEQAPPTAESSALTPALLGVGALILVAVVAMRLRSTRR